MYKALISDVDGTLIPNRKDGQPSAAVIEAVRQAGQKMHVGIATSRPLFMLEHIFKMLPLSGPCVISGGSQIYDATTKEVVWEKRISAETIQEVYEIVRHAGMPVFVNDGNQDIPWSDGYQPEAALGVFMPNLEPTVAQQLHDQLKVIEDVSAHQIAAHEPGKIILDLTHALATKQHGVLEVAKMLNIETKEIIGVGDGYNDFPLLMACGLKVAMGNAVEDLKAIADYVAPTVDEDGVAVLINKYVL